MRLVVSSVVLSFLVASAACSSNTDTATDGGTTGNEAGGDAATGSEGGGDDGGGGDAGDGGGGGDAGVVVVDGGAAALGALMPQVVRLNTTNAVMLNPKVMPITYDDDTRRTDIEAFITNYAQSTAWTSATSEYGVGTLSSATPQHITGNAPGTIVDSTVIGMLQANLGGASPAWGAPDPNTIYAFFFPAGTIVDDGTGSKSCTDYDGYHYEAAVGTVIVPYAIIVACPGFDGPRITDLQQLTIVASHEIVEAATDPFVESNPGFAQTDDPHNVWTAITGGETGDMCSYADTFPWAPPDMTYSVQRMWSNAAAAAGHDPCVGAPTTPYYQTVPTLPDNVTVSGPVATKALKIAVGATGMLTVTVYADAAGGPYIVSFDDYNHVYGGGQTYLQATVPSGPFNAGDQFQVPVKVLGKDMQLGAEAFVLNTKPAMGSGPTTYFYGFIGQ
jgi:hypothetical protein